MNTEPMNTEPMSCTPTVSARFIIDEASHCLNAEDALMDARICKYNGDQLAEDLQRLLVQAHQIKVDPAQVNELALQLAR